MNKKEITITIVGIIFVSALLILLSTINNQKYIMSNGTLLALTLDGNSVTSFPGKGNYHVDINCTGGIGKYQPVNVLDSSGLETDEYEMKFTVENIISSSVKCNLDFVTITDNNINNYLATNIVSGRSTEITSTNNNGNTDISYRYTGKQPDNWVWFNNELWRIIGSIPTCMDDNCSSQLNLIKIARAESIGSLVYHSSESNTTWGSGNTLYTLLNEYYLGKKEIAGISPCVSRFNWIFGTCDYKNKGISSVESNYYRRMLEPVYMNAGTVADTLVSINTSYRLETNTLTSSPVKIGLITASDYGYATSDILYDSVSLYDVMFNVTNNWLYSISSQYEWTMTPKNTSNILVTDGGKLEGYEPNTGRPVRPVVYLDPNVYIISGEGTEANPYILGM